MIRLPRSTARSLAALVGAALLSSAGAAAGQDTPGPATPPPGQPAPPAAGPGRSPAADPPAPEARRVVYLPESTKAQLREELRREVLEQARREGWAAPGQVPSWLARLRPLGDVRGRFEQVLFPAGNAATGDFPDFNAINTGRPADFSRNLADLANDRFLNVDQDRARARLRARLGVDVDLAEGFTAGVRLASGDGGSPVSTNQTLGGGGGNFSRYQVWLDRAYLRWAPAGALAGLAVVAGRLENPFLVTDLTFSENVNLDGLAVRWAAGQELRPFVAGGAFPLYATGFAYPADATSKLPSRDRWLYGAQAGLQWRPVEALTLQLAAGWFHFDRVEGQPSGPCDTSLKDVVCDTDDTRPGFAQKGNSYRPLRTPNARAIQQEALGAPQYQYFGLASRFEELVATAQASARLGSALAVRLDGEFVKNLAFQRTAVAGVAINNRAPCVQGACPFAGGDQGWLARLSVGSAAPDDLGSWTAALAYRHLESDAVLDALNDSDFGLGGTNLKGYQLSASAGLARGVSLGARWSSADAVSGPTYRVDQLQVDLLARF